MKSVPVSRPSLSDEEVYAKLQALEQEHLLQHFPELSTKQKESFKRQVAYIDPDLFQRQKEPEEPLQKGSFEPFQAYFPSGNKTDHLKGRELVKEGKAALLVLAGGQGSRLRCKGPKGCCAVTAVKHKSLFQLLAEKIKAASVQINRPLEVAIMTSPLNHVEIQTFFAQHAFFGLDPKQLTFFYQRMWPFLNFEGNFFLEAPDQIARGPNGNGGVFRRLVELGIWDKWHKMGVEMVNVVPIDNPLAAPFDFELFGFHARQACDVTIKAAVRRDAAEKVGVLASIKGKASILEYSELSEEDRIAEDSSGKLKFGLANLGLYCFSMPFIEQVSHKTLPLHRAKKAVIEMNAQKETIFPEKPNAWKFEEFIFDVLPFAENVQALLFPRSLCFAPLKNLKGEDSIVTVREALLAFDRQIFAKVTGSEPPSDSVFELSPQFYYPTEELLDKWKGQPFPDKDYIHD